ncbi:nucleotidyltransferase domain-containing protein [Pseudomonas sp. TH31]|uniref:nucleotidyltransferase domain-containing protein n=1 Tax=Pseudomonas sp. TH31 TaxID=2796396 RepID=UPI0019149CF3|nr:nucleotidyltransferase domain-containing protein [Pseudomonas sp. TH31]MBK5418123.1 nucleotidyltransferase domain-containing protein [Pseudomonas sp. TH31]
MQASPHCGVDSNGFILATPNGPIQSGYEDLVRDVCATLVAQAQPLLDGIYLYGSVARGDAVSGMSDLDVTLVLRGPASSADQERIEAIRQALAARHSEVVKIDFDIGHRTEVLAQESLLSWGYWLKHHCRCVWGNDLSERFASFKPSRAIALAVNGDFEAVLNRYAERIERETDPDERSRLQREASRKLIRSTGILRSDQDLFWPQTLDEHTELFVKHYPSMAAQIEFFLSLATTSTAPANEFAAQLRVFVRWMGAAVDQC